MSFKDKWGRLCQKASVRFSLILLGLILTLSLFGPMMTPYGYKEQQIKEDGTYLSNMPPRIPFLKALGIPQGQRLLKDRRAEYLSDSERYPAGSVIKTLNHRLSEGGIEYCDVLVDYYIYMGVEEDVSFWLGTDQLGRDLWTRLWRGCRTTLLIVLIAVSAEFLIGTAYGVWAGFRGEKTDLWMMRITEVIRSIPQVVTCSLLIMLLGSGAFSMILALTLRGWVGTAQIMRAQTLRLKEEEFVLAARLMGAGPGRLIGKHILPSALSPLITTALLAVPGAIFTESFLAYIGLGIPAPESSLGTLLAGAWSVMELYPYQTIFPALLVCLLMLCFTLLSEGIREAADPSQRGRSV